MKRKLQSSVAAKVGSVHDESESEIAGRRHAVRRFRTPEARRVRDTGATRLDCRGAAPLAIRMGVRYRKGGRSPDMFANVLIANRGEIACRIVRTARRHGNAVDRPPHAGRPRGAFHPPRRRGARDRRRRERLSRSGRHSRAGEDSRRRMFASWLRIPVRERRFRRSLRQGWHRLRWPAARGDADDGPEKLGQGADAAGGRAGRARLSWRQPEPEIPAREGL